MKSRRSLSTEEIKELKSSCRENQDGVTFKIDDFYRFISAPRKDGRSYTLIQICGALNLNSSSVSTILRRHALPFSQLQGLTKEAFKAWKNKSVYRDRPNIKFPCRTSQIKRPRKAKLTSVLQEEPPHKKIKLNEKKIKKIKKKKETKSKIKNNLPSLYRNPCGFFYQPPPNILKPQDFFTSPDILGLLDPDFTNEDYVLNVIHTTGMNENSQPNQPNQPNQLNQNNQGSQFSGFDWLEMDCLDSDDLAGHDYEKNNKGFNSSQGI